MNYCYAQSAEPSSSSAPYRQFVQPPQFGCGEQLVLHHPDAGARPSWPLRKSTGRVATTIVPATFIEAPVAPTRPARSVVRRYRLADAPSPRAPRSPPTQSNPDPAQDPPEAPRTLAGARVRHRPAPVAPTPAPRACPRAQGCATPTTASAIPRDGARLGLRASQPGNSRAPPAPSPRRSSAAASPASQKPPGARRSHARHRPRNLVPFSRIG